MKQLFFEVSVPYNWKYGVRVPYSYGASSSERVVGHSGAQSSCAFMDPAHELVVAWVCNGMPGEKRHQERARLINEVIYQEAGIV